MSGDRVVSGEYSYASRGFPAGKEAAKQATSLTEEENEEEMTLEEFVSTHTLPQRAKVTEGFDDRFNPDNSFSTNDIIEVRRVQCPFVILKFTNPQTQREVRLSVPTRNSTNFRLVSTSGGQKCRVFGDVREVARAWPLAVTARHAYTPPNGELCKSYKSGDVLRVVRLDKSRGVGGASGGVLEFKHLQTLELIRLNIDHVGVFSEFNDESRTFTLGELADMARVPRTLLLSPADQKWEATTSSPLTWIPGIPPDFEGVVQVEKPDYLVEIGAIIDDSEDEEADEVASSSRFLVPIDSEITVAAREADYTAVAYKRRRLDELATRYSSILPRLARVTSWEEETTVLQNQLVRPGDVLVLYHLEAVTKLAVRTDHRKYFIPLNHPSFFQLTGLTPGKPFRLEEVESPAAASTERFKFPFTMMAGDTPTYVNDDDERLPKKIPLLVDGFVEEQTVVAAKISFGNLMRPAFHLPLRTRLEVCFMSRWRGSVENLNFSRWDPVTEEVTAYSYSRALGGKMHTYDDVVPRFSCPRPAPPTTPAGTANGSDLSTPPPLPPRRQCASFSAAHGRPPLPLPGQRPSVSRSSTLPLPLSQDPSRRNVPAAPSTRVAGGNVPLPPLPAPSSTSRTLPPPPPPTPPTPPAPLHTEDGDSDSDYETMSDELDYEMVDTPDKPFNKHEQDLSIPVDGNICHFTAAQMQLLLLQLNAPLETLHTWNKLGVDGQNFAQMSNDELAQYKLNKPLVLYFRDRSRLNVLNHL